MNAAARHPEPIPLGVCDDDGGTGAVSNGNQEIDLLDLGSGARLRRLAALDRPLMIDGGRLIACRFDHMLPGMILDRIALPPGEADASALVSLSLPDWPQGPQPAAVRFAIRFFRQGAVYELYWRARSDYAGGAAPPHYPEPGMNPGPVCGRFDIAADGFDLQATSREDGFAVERADAKRGEDLTRHAQGVVYRQAGKLRNAPWRTSAGELYLRAEPAPAGHQQILGIARVEAPHHPALARLEARDPGMLVPELSLDGRHIAVVAGDERSGAPIWRIHSAEDGRQLGSIEYRDGLCSFRLFGKRLICLEERHDREDFTIRVDRALHAFELSTGTLLWSYKLATRKEPDPAYPPE